MNFLQEQGLLSGEMGSGVIIQEVMKDSLASQIGLTTGDIILKVNEHIIDQSTLVTALANYTNTTDNILTIQTINGEIQEKNFSCTQDCKLGISMSPNSTLEIKKVKF